MRTIFDRRQPETRKIASACRRPALRSRRPRAPAGQPPAPPPPRPATRHFWSVAIFILLVSGVCIRAYRDLSRPDAWDYWKDLYVTPSMTSPVVDTVDLDGSDQGARKAAGAVSRHDRPCRRELVSRPIGRGQAQAGRPRAAVFPRRRSRPIRDHGRNHPARALATAVGTTDASGQIRPGSCASACVFVYAGGTARFGGSALGVHRFTTRPVDDPSRTPSG